MSMDVNLDATRPKTIPFENLYIGDIFRQEQDSRVYKKMPNFNIIGSYSGNAVCITDGGALTKAFQPNAKVLLLNLEATAVLSTALRTEKISTIASNVLRKEDE